MIKNWNFLLHQCDLWTLLLPHVTYTYAISLMQARFNPRSMHAWFNPCKKGYHTRLTNCSASLATKIQWCNNSPTYAMAIAAWLGNPSASDQLAPAAAFSSLMQVGNKKNYLNNNKMKICHKGILKLYLNIHLYLFAGNLKVETHSFLHVYQHDLNLEKLPKTASSFSPAFPSQAATM